MVVAIVIKSSTYPGKVSLYSVKSHTLQSLPRVYIYRGLHLLSKRYKVRSDVVSVCALCAYALCVRVMHTRITTHAISGAKGGLDTPKPSVLRFAALNGAPLRRPI